jgi:hypothetical protein
MISEGRPNVYTERQYHKAMEIRRLNPTRSFRLIAFDVGMDEKCALCDGTGKVDPGLGEGPRLPCSECKASGRSTERAEIRLRTWAHQAARGIVPRRFRPKKSK